MITVIGNLKGGTGKSTVAFNLALWLLERGRSVRVCDVDPQASLKDAAEVRVEEGYDPALEVATSLPSRAQGEVLVDIGLGEAAVHATALARAGRVLIPVAPSQADIWSTQRFLRTIAEASKGRRKPEVLAFLNRADTHPASRENGEALAALESLDGVKVLSTQLGQRIAFRRSFSEGLAVFELEPSGKAAVEVDALAAAVFGAT